MVEHTTDRDMAKIDKELCARLRERLLETLLAPALADVLFNVIASINLPAFNDRDIVTAVGQLLTRYEEVASPSSAEETSTCFFDNLHIYMLPRGLLKGGLDRFKLSEAEAVDLARTAEGRSQIRGLLSVYEEDNGFNLDAPLRWALIAVACTWHQQHFCPGLVLWLLCGRVFDVSPRKRARGLAGAGVATSSPRAGAGGGKASDPFADASGSGGCGAGESGACAAGPGAEQTQEHATSDATAQHHLYTVELPDSVSRKHSSDDLAAQCDRVFLDGAGEYTLLHVLAQNGFVERYHASELASGNKWCEFGFDNMMDVSEEMEEADAPFAIKKCFPPFHVLARIVTEDCDEPRNSSLLPLSSADLLKYLLQRHTNLDPNVAGKKSGRTPLHYAVLLGNSKAVRVLLDAGACVELQDSAGYGAIHYLAAFSNPKLQRAFVGSKNGKQFLEACGKGIEVGNWSRRSEAAALQPSGANRTATATRAKKEKDFRVVHRLQNFRDEGCARELMRAFFLQVQKDSRADAQHCSRLTVANHFSTIAFLYRIELLARAPSGNPHNEFLFQLSNGKRGAPVLVQLPRMSSFAAKLPYGLNVGKGAHSLAAMLPPAAAAAVLASGIECQEAALRRIGRDGDLRGSGGAGEEQDRAVGLLFSGADELSCPFSPKAKCMKNLARCHALFSDRVARADSLAGLVETAWKQEHGGLHAHDKLRHKILVLMAETVFRRAQLAEKCVLIADEMIASVLPLVVKVEGNNVGVAVASGPSSTGQHTTIAATDQQRKADRAKTVRKLRESILSKATERTSAGRRNKHRTPADGSTNPADDASALQELDEAMKLVGNGFSHQDDLRTSLGEAYSMKATALWRGANKDGENALCCFQEAQKHLASSSFWQTMTQCQSLSTKHEREQEKDGADARTALQSSFNLLHQLDAGLIPLITEYVHARTPSEADLAVRAARTMSPFGANMFLTQIKTDGSLDRVQAAGAFAAKVDLHLQQQQRQHDHRDNPESSEAATTSAEVAASVNMKEHKFFNWKAKKTKSSAASGKVETDIKQKVIEALTRKAAGQHGGSGRKAPGGASATYSCSSDSRAEAAARSRLQELENIFERDLANALLYGTYSSGEFNEMSMERLRLLKQLYGAETESRYQEGREGVPAQIDEDDVDAEQQECQQEEHAARSTKTRKKKNGGKNTKGKRRGRGNKNKHQQGKTVPQAQLPGMNNTQAGAAGADEADDCLSAPFQAEWTKSSTRLRELRRQSEMESRLQAPLTDRLQLLVLQISLDTSVPDDGRGKMDKSSTATTVKQHIASAAAGIRMVEELWPRAAKRLLRRKASIEDDNSLNHSFPLLLVVPCGGSEARGAWERALAAEQNWGKLVQMADRAQKGSATWSAGHTCFYDQKFCFRINFCYRVFAWRNLLAGCYEEALEVCTALRRRGTAGATTFMCELLCLLFLEATDEEEAAGETPPEDAWSRAQLSCCEDAHHSSLIHLLEINSGDAPRSTTPQSFFIQYAPNGLAVARDAASEMQRLPPTPRSSTASRAPPTSGPSSQSESMVSGLRTNHAALFERLRNPAAGGAPTARVPCVQPQRQKLSTRLRSRTRSDVISDLFSTEYGSRKLKKSRTFHEKVLHNTDARLAGVIVNRLRRTEDVLRYVGSPPDDAASEYANEVVVVHYVMEAFLKTAFFLPLQYSNLYQMHPVVQATLLAEIERDNRNCPLQRTVDKHLCGEITLTLAQEDNLERELREKRRHEGRARQRAAEADCASAAAGEQKQKPSIAVPKKKELNLKNYRAQRPSAGQAVTLATTLTKPNRNPPACSSSLGAWRIDGEVRTFYSGDPDVFFVKDNLFAALNPNVTCRELRTQFEHALRKGQCAKEEKSNGVKFLGGIAELKINSDKRLWADTQHVDAESGQALLLFDHEDNHTGIKRQTAKAAARMKTTAANDNSRRVSGSGAGATVNDTVKLLEDMIRETEGAPAVVRDILGLPRNVKPDSSNTWRPVVEAHRYMNAGTTAGQLAKIISG